MSNDDDHGDHDDDHDQDHSGTGNVGKNEYLLNDFIIPYAKPLLRMPRQFDFCFKRKQTNKQTKKETAMMKISFTRMKKTNEKKKK